MGVEPGRQLEQASAEDFVSPPPTVEVLGGLITSSTEFRLELMVHCCTMECGEQMQRELFIEQRDSMPTDLRPFITAYSLEDYARMNARLFLTPCGRAGYGLIGDELISVFCLPGAKLGAEMIREAVQRGAAKLDCIDAHGRLSRFYATLGFQEVGRASWVDELAPAGWNYERFGRPDIVFMKILNLPENCNAT